MSANAQIVRFIHNAYQAEYYIFETKDSSAANYFVFKTANPAEAIKEGVWSIVDDVQLKFRRRLDECNF